MKIKIQEIKHRGNDEERIALRVLEDCNLCRYLVLDTTFDKDGNISNLERELKSRVLAVCRFQTEKGIINPEGLKEYLEEEDNIVLIVKLIINTQK